MKAEFDYNYYFADIINIVRISLGDIAPLKIMMTIKKFILISAEKVRFA